MTNRTRYVTDQVLLWITNDSAEIKNARWYAEQGAKGLQAYISYVLQKSRQGEAAWRVARELAPNDYDRVLWVEVQNELLSQEM